MITNIPYVYLIGWTKLDKWYIGVRYRKNCCQPSDFWKTYFTSSKHVAKFRQEHGEPDHIEILKTFNNAKEARIYEEQKLKEFDVLKDPKWLNKNISGRYFGGSNFVTEETRIKLSKALKGKSCSEATKQKIRERKYYTEEKSGLVKTFGPNDIIPEGWIKGNWNPNTIKKIREKAIGRKASEETRKKISIAHKGRVFSKESRLKMSIAKQNMSEETRKKISKYRKGKILKEETKQKIREKMIQVRKNKNWSTKSLC